MASVCNDAAFGEMHYKHRWVKTDKIFLFGEEWNVSVVAKAYSGKPITNAQRESYQWFKENLSSLTKRITSTIIDYINTYCVELAETWLGARMVNSANDLSGIVEPTAIQFQQDGAVLLLMECKWDIENGLAIRLAPDFAIGCQSAFL